MADAVAVVEPIQAAVTADPAAAALPNSANIIQDKKGPGILIRTLKRGDDKSFPKKGDMCLIHYDGRLENGTHSIASSRKNNNNTRNDHHSSNFSSNKDTAALQFELGARHILGGLEVAVEHMSVGQTVEATIPALYAYGHVGYPPKIPPRATLIFQIKLIGFTTSNNTSGANVVVNTTTTTTESTNEEVAGPA